jgi:hypothetical protein
MRGLIRGYSSLRNFIFLAIVAVYAAGIVAVPAGRFLCTILSLDAGWIPYAIAGCFFVVLGLILWIYNWLRIWSFLERKP